MRLFIIMRDKMEWKISSVQDLSRREECKFEYFINTFNLVARFNVIFHVNVSTMIIIHYIFVGRSRK